MHYAHFSNLGYAYFPKGQAKAFRYTFEKDPYC